MKFSIYIGDMELIYTKNFEQSESISKRPFWLAIKFDSPRSAYKIARCVAGFTNVSRHCHSQQCSLRIIRKSVRIRTPYPQQDSTAYFRQTVSCR